MDIENREQGRRVQTQGGLSVILAGSELKGDTLIHGGTNEVEMTCGECAETLITHKGVPLGKGSVWNFTDDREGRSGCDAGQALHGDARLRELPLSARAAAAAFPSPAAASLCTRGSQLLPL